MLGHGHGMVLGGNIMDDERKEQVDTGEEKLAPDKLYTEAEFTKRLTSEVDRRVESGIQKGLETNKQKWQREFEESANLTAEQLAQKKLEEKTNELTQKEIGVALRANKIDAREAFNAAEVPKAQYEKFIDMLVSDDAEVTVSNVKNFVDMFNVTKNDIETRLKSEMSIVKNPKQGDSEKPLSKKEFDALPYAKKAKIKQEQPEIWKQFMNQ